jgi:hypothetical protein
MHKIVMDMCHVIFNNILNNGCLTYINYKYGNFEGHLSLYFINYFQHKLFAV